MTTFNLSFLIFTRCRFKICTQSAKNTCTHVAEKVADFLLFSRCIRESAVVVLTKWGDGVVVSRDVEHVNDGHAQESGHDEDEDGDDGDDPGVSEQVVLEAVVRAELKEDCTKKDPREKAFATSANPTLKKETKILNFSQNFFLRHLGNRKISLQFLRSKRRYNIRSEVLCFHMRF